MVKPDSDQLAALEELRRLDPNLEIEWDEDTGTPRFIHGILSRPVLPSATKPIAEQAPESALAFLTQYRALYQLKDPRAEFPRSRVISDDRGTTVHLYQIYEGVEVLDGELSVAVDAQSQITQVLGRYRPHFDISTNPTLSAEDAIQRALAHLDADDKNLAPITHRLLIANDRTLGGSLVDRALLVWRIDLQDWVYFVDAHDGSILLSYDNTQTARNRETFSTNNCRLLPGTLWLSESGPVPGKPVDDISQSAHRNAGAVYDYYFAKFGLDSFDGRGGCMVSTVHSGVNNGFTCDQNNAAFLPSLVQIVYGNGDGVRFGPFAHALDVVAHEWQHAVTYFAITWSDGRPRGLDYRDESGALNESYSDFFGALVEGRDWFLGEDCYTPNTPNDALRDMADPARYGQPDHYSKYVTSGTQSYRVHVNSGIMNKAGHLMCEGGTHYGISVAPVGREAAASIWYRALKHHLQGASGFVDARRAFLQACQELFPADTAKYAAVQNACAAVGVGEAAAPAPNIVAEPAQLDFGSVAVRTTTSQTITVRNTGNAELSVTAIELAAGPFSISGETVFRLPAGTSRSLSVAFAPVTTGPQQASIAIRSNDPDQPSLSVPLTGVATGVPSIGVEPAILDFGNVLLGQSAQLQVTVSNSGSADLVVSDVRTDPGAFSVSGETGFQLSPGASRGVLLRFAPVAVGTQQATLTIESNDPNRGTVNLDLIGAGLGMPQIVVDPLSLDFGGTAIGQSTQRSITVRNNGSLTLMVTSVRCDRAVFSTPDTPSFALAPGTSESLTVHFSPVAVGLVEGTLSLESNDASQPMVSVALYGNGTPIPHITVEPDRLDFGSVALEHSAQLAITIRNIGTADLSVAGLDLAPGPFLLSGDTSFTLAPAGSRQVAIHFAPSQVGTASAALTIRSNDVDRANLAVPLSGVAVALPQVAVEPTTVSFGSVPIGQSIQRTLTVRNAGSAELVVSAIALPIGEFSLQGETSFQLQPAGAQSLGLTFAPTAIGIKQSSVTVHSNDADHPSLSIPLQAEALGVARLEVDPTQVDFGAVLLGQTAQRSIVIRNTGSGQLSVSIAELPDGPFSVSGEMTFELAPATFRELMIAYAPMVPGQDQSSLLVRSDDPDQPSLPVPLVGSAMGIAQISIDPGQLDWGTVTIGQPIERSLTLRNPGSSELLVSNLQCDSPAFSVTGATVFALAPQSTRTLTVSLKSDTPGSFQSVLAIHSNAQDQPIVTVPLSATVAGVSDIRVEPSQVDFGTVILGQAAQRTFTVRNVGSADLSVSAIQLPVGPFRLPGATAFVLAPATEQLVTIEFFSDQPGSYQTAVTIESSDSDQPVWEVAIAARATGVPRIDVVPTQLDFGPVNLGATEQRTLSVRNTGSADLLVSGINLPEGTFSITGDITFTLAPAGSRDIPITYAPLQAGAHSASLTIDSNDTAQPSLIVSLSGTGTTVSKITVEPASLEFGAVNIGESLARDLMVHSSGSADLSVHGLDLPVGPFACTGEGPFSLPPGASRSVRVTFTPTSAGPQLTTLSIRSSDPLQGALEVPLSGTATAVARIAVEPASLDLGTVILGQSATGDVTVHNPGSAELAVAGMDLSEDSFTLEGEPAFQLAPGTSQPVTVRFTPTVIALIQAGLVIRSNAIGQPSISVELRASAVGAPSISIEPERLDFDTITVGQSTSAALTVRNTGSADLLVSSMDVSAGPFALTGEESFRLGRGESHELNISFTPSRSGLHQSVLTIHSNDSTRPALAIPLQGSSLGVPQIAAEPAQLDWGSISLGQSVERTLTLRNPGSADLLVSDVVCDNTAFAVSGPAVFALAPQTTRNILVSFTPPTAGLFTASLFIHSNAQEQPILAIALGATAVGTSDIRVEPAQIDFGSVLLGQAAQRILTVRNVGSADLTVSHIQIPTGPFRFSGDTAFTLSPSEERNLTIAFAPDVLGANQGTLTIHSSDGDQPEWSVTMFGIAIGLPLLDVEPKAIDFGTVALGQSERRILTLSNLGTASLAISGIDYPPGPFSIGGNPLLDLAPGASHALSIAYAPTEADAHQATLTIHSDDPDQSSFEVSLQGTGVGVPEISVEPNTLDFGTIPLGQSAERALVVRNVGNADLVILEIEVSTGEFELDGEMSFMLGPDALRTVGIHYQPTAPGAQQATLTIRSNDPDRPLWTVVLRAACVGIPSIDVDVADLDFGSVVVGTLAQMSLTVRNAGTADLTVSAIQCDDPSFYVEGPTSFQLSPSAEHGLTVIFAPSSPGSKAVDLEIECDDPDRPTLTIGLLANAIGIPLITVEPTHLEWGTIPLGQLVQRSVALRNPGSADLLVSAIECDNPAFSVSGATIFALAPRATKVLTVAFNADAMGLFDATLTIQSNAEGNAAVAVTLSASVIGLSDINIEPTQIDFGTVTLGQAAQRTLTVHNAGTADLTVFAIELAGGSFDLSGDTSFTLAPGGSQSVTVSFGPETPGAHETTLTIKCSDHNQPAWVVVVSGAALGVPRLAVEPLTLDFGTVALGQSSQRILTLRNVGSGELLVSDLHSDQPAFAVSAPTRFGLEPGTQREVILQLAPVSAGPQQGTLTIVSDDSAQPEVAVALVGHTADVPKISTEPDRLDFGSVAVGSSSQLSLTVRNIGGPLLEVSGISVDRGVPPEALRSFHILGNTMFQLLPDESETLDLRFEPDPQGANGQQRAVLAIQSNDPRWPILPVDMQGVSEPTSVPGPHIVIEPDRVDFGSVPLGQSSRRQLTVKNTGTEILQVVRMHSDRDVFSVIDHETLLLRPSESQLLTLQYEPTGAAMDRGRLTLMTNDPQSPEVIVLLAGVSTTCAAAAATYGSPMQKDLYTLRSLRDQTLVNSAMGRWVVDVYYRWSPQIASWIAFSPGRRALVRAALQPVISLARHSAASTRPKAESEGLSGQPPQ